MGVLYFLFEEVDVFFGGADEVDALEVREAFLDVLDLLDEVDVIFVELGLGVDDRNDAGGLVIEDQSLHLGDFRKQGVEVVLRDRQDV